MKSRHTTTTLSIVATLMILCIRTDAGQDRITDLMSTGSHQLEAAWSTNTDAAFQEAQDTFGKVLAVEHDNPRALIYSGEAKLMRAYLLAAQARYGLSTELLRSGIADMDRAISLAPERTDLRLERGLSYGPVAAYLSKSEVAREDLEFATRDPQFSRLPADRRAHAFQVLGIVYTNLKEPQKAAEAFRASVAADSESRFAKDASERLRTLLASGLEPDRFPGITQDTSPIVAAVSITYQNTKSGEVPMQLEDTRKAIRNFPGLLALHTLASADKPGMFVLLTWWKNKRSLNDFYYSDLHQAWMKMRGRALTGGAQAESEPVVSQLSVEIFGQFAAGIQVHGGLIPAELFEGQKR